MITSVFSVTRTVATLAVLAISTAAGAVDYYVSPSGNDANAGTSPAAAWQTTAKVNAVDFSPGDQILFEGGQTFAGGLSFTAADSGTAAQPVVVSSYGTGRATIQVSTAAEAGINTDKTQGIEIRDLVFVGPGAAASTMAGLRFTAISGTLTYFRIDNVDVSGFEEGGRFAPDGGAAYYDIRVTNSDFHANRLTGFATWAWPKVDSINDIYVGDCRFYENLGQSGLSNHSGSGIVLGQVNGGVIERCEAFGNGSLGFGSVGIWSWDSDNVVIQFCESHHNRSGGSTDGGGFDLDGAQHNSIVQYNYSHDNDGAGLMIAQWDGAREMSNNVFRYNISQNDGRKNGYGGILVWSGDDQPATAVFYHNVIAMSPAATGTPKAISLLNNNHDGVVIANNIFITSGGVPLFQGSTDLTKLLMAGNAYYSSGDTFRIIYNGTTYNSLDAFRTATGQEMLAGSPVGMEIDPQLANAFGGETIGDPYLLDTLTAYELEWTSPLRDAGVDLLTAFGIDAGGSDFFGNASPDGPAPDIGAHELSFAGNNAPAVGAGPNLYLATPQDTVALDGTVTDDGLPNPPGAVTTTWSKVSGPGSVVFNDPATIDTTATLSTPGVYILRLTADDGEFQRFDDATVTYEAVPHLQFDHTDLGDGLHGWTFRLVNDDGLLLSYAVTMSFYTDPGTDLINVQINGMDVNDEPTADFAAQFGFDADRDTYSLTPFVNANSIPGNSVLWGDTFTGYREGEGWWEMAVGTGSGSQYGNDTSTAYVVAGGNVHWAGTIARNNELYPDSGATDLVEGTVLGDFTGDGVVDTADYTYWADHFGQMCSAYFAPGSYAEPDHPINTAEYTTWADHFGDTAPLMLSATATSMPLAPKISVPPVAGGPSVGDFNSDGRVDEADYVIWQDNAGKTGPDVLGDANGDGRVNTADLTALYDHFGQGVNR